MIKLKLLNNIKYDNRGMDFEKLLNQSNNYYRHNDIAIIHKKPTPIKIISIDNKNKIINKAVFEMPSTTDYNGIYKGRYIDFEAKETMNKTSFPLNNIHLHQLKHLKDCKNLGGISFIIVNFKVLNKIYVMDIDDILIIKRKSIPLKHFVEKGIEVSNTYLCPIDFIKAIDILIKKEQN